MQTLTEDEIDEIIKSHLTLIGAELQQVRYNEKSLQLNLYKNSNNYWLTFLLKPGVPYFFISKSNVRLIENQKKPVSNFIVKHFVSSKLTIFKRKIELGRVIELGFGKDKIIQLSFITGRVNVSVFASDRVVHAFKPKEIPSQNNKSVFDKAKRAIRSNSFFEELWSQKQKVTKKKETFDAEKTLNKKKEALRKMEEGLEQQEGQPWLELGQWLKTQSSMEFVPKEFSKLIEMDKSLSWNIENAFNQKKKRESKKEGTLKRILELKEQIEKIQSGDWNDSRVDKKQSSLLYEANLKGKTLEFNEGRLFIGKSGQDNLKLLRKAKPWYLWLHIKDYPGAYGIFEKLKNSQDPSEKVMREAAMAVIRQSIPKNQSGRFELIFTECRYVRPIKGAKSGQVTYSHEKVISVKV